MSDPRSWNPWHGCKKYSEGCAHCYMFALDSLHKVPEKSSQITRTSAMRLPISRNRAKQFKIPAGYTLRVNMTSDTFLEEADAWRDEMWEMVRARPDVVFYLLTKRAHRIAECLPEDWGDGYENVTLNVSCENQRAFDERWPHLRDVPAKHKGFNLAPLIGPINLVPALETGQVEHVDCAGESYGGTRVCRYEWVKRLSDDCRAYGANFTFDSTGSTFAMGERTYHLRKGIQTEQAFKSGLSHFEHDFPYRLFDPTDGHELEKHELYQRMHNPEKCLMCPMLRSCPGCAVCTSCKGAPRVGLEEMVRLQEATGYGRA